MPANTKINDKSPYKTGYKFLPILGLQLLLNRALWSDQGASCIIAARAPSAVRISSVLASMR